MLFLVFISIYICSWRELIALAIKYSFSLVSTNNDHVWFGFPIWPKYWFYHRLRLTGEKNHCPSRKKKLYSLNYVYIPMQSYSAVFTACYLC